MELIWRLVAFIVSRPPVADWLIARAQRTPYFHLPGYMNRWWLFNGYPPNDDPDNCDDRRRFRWLPSIRVHHILRADTAEHPHDHPWNARTIILRGGYREFRAAPPFWRWGYGRDQSWPEGRTLHVKLPGDTAAIRFGDFHHIAQVTEGGVWTLFIAGAKRGGWGFLVDGVKVPWREYEQRFPPRTEADAATDGSHP